MNMTRLEAKNRGWIIPPRYSIYETIHAELLSVEVKASMKIDNIQWEIKATGPTIAHANLRLMVAIEVFEKNMPKPWRASPDCPTFERKEDANG